MWERLFDGSPPSPSYTHLLVPQATHSIILIKSQPCRPLPGLKSMRIQSTKSTVVGGFSASHGASESMQVVVLEPGSLVLILALLFATCLEMDQYFNCLKLNFLACKTRILIALASCFYENQAI